MGDEAVRLLLPELLIDLLGLLLARGQDKERLSLPVTFRGQGTDQIQLRL